MTDYYYLNTNPFVSWAEFKAGSMDSRTMKIGQFVEKLMADSNAVRTLSEITVVEAFNKFCSLWRDSGPGRDQAWAESVQNQLMTWMQTGDLQVLPLPSKLFEKTIYYVVTATREHNSSLRAWDAAHLYQAAAWSRTVGQRVRLVTSDQDFPKILAVYPEFGTYVDILDPAV